MTIPDRIRIDVHHHIRIPGLEALVKISEKLDVLESAIAALEARVAEDFDELKRRIEENTATEEEVARFHALVDRLKAVDPLPEFPAAPEPDPTPDPDEDGDEGEPGEDGE